MSEETKYELRLEQFSGPIEKLFELIESRKMEVTELNLAAVTDDFIKYVEALKAKGEPKSEEEMRLMADFIVVASRLLLIKSKSVLPNLELTLEEEEGIHDLEDRLKRYQQFKPMIALFKETYQNSKRSASRTLFAGKPVIFYPPKNVSSDILYKILEGLFEAFKQISLEIKTIEITLVRLEDKIEEIIGKIKDGISQFSNIANGKNRAEIIVLFLALLHLLKDQIIKAEQEEKFSEIMIESRN